MDESPAIPPPANRPLAAPTVHSMTFRRPGPRTWARIGAAATHATVRVNGRFVGEHVGAWTPFEFEITQFLRSGDADENELEIRCEDRVHTTNGFLPTIGVRWAGVRQRGGGFEIDVRDGSALPTAAVRQRSATRGTQLLVDGQPLVVRGILHWGYYPELVHPWPADEQIRFEISHLKSLGFNLIKFCLWIPPPSYYEICDEMDMLVWQEYPVWNAPLQSKIQSRRAGTKSTIETDADPIVREFTEFFLQDRAYRCIILRTLTCENDHVSADMSRGLVDLAHETIPGCLVLDNSGWLCNEQYGDFHDEHPYVHNALWPFYGQRMRGKLTKPLLLGETMVADTLNERFATEFTGTTATRLAAQRLPHGGEVSFIGDVSAARLNVGQQAALRESYQAALAMRRFQIETLQRELPDAGYVVCALRDLENTPLGLFTHDGKPKYTPDEWAWHGAPSATTRTISAIPAAADALDGPIQPALGGILGPRKGAWKCSENTWWSPIVRVLDSSLPVELIQGEAIFELLSGRVLTHTDGTRVLVEQLDVHSGVPRRNPLVVEFRSEGRWRIVSAFRHDTPAGAQLWHALRSRIDSPAVAPPPEIGPLCGTSIVLESWQMALPDWPSSILFDPNLPRQGVGWARSDDDARAVEMVPGGAHSPPLGGAGSDWVSVRCDTSLVNAGRTVFEGWALFRTRFDYPGGKRILRCESVADYFEVFIDGTKLAEFGPRHGTWDGTRDIPRDIEVDLPAGEHTIVFRVRDWRAAGGMVGPVFLASDLNERVF